MRFFVLNHLAFVILLCIPLFHNVALLCSKRARTVCIEALRLNLGLTPHVYGKLLVSCLCRIPEALQKFMPNNMKEIKFRKKKDAKGRFVPL